MKWGISCEVDSDEAMGRILGAMKLCGAHTIGYEPIAATATAKATAAPSKRKYIKVKKAAPLLLSSDKPKNWMDAITRFVTATDRDTFDLQDLRDYLQHCGYVAKNINMKPAVDEGFVHRVSNGTYKKGRAA